MLFDPSDHQILSITNITFNSFSLMSCLYLLFTNSKSSNLTDPQFKLILNIFISDTLIALTGFTRYFIDHHDSFYQINTVLSLIALWSSNFFASTLAIFLYRKIARARGLNSPNFYKKSLIAWFITCFCLPVITYLVLFFGFGIQYSSLSDNKFKQITYHTTQIVLFIAFEAVPFVAGIFVTFLCAVKQINVLKELEIFDLGDISAMKILKYPFAQSLVFLPAVVCKSLFIFSPYTNILLRVIKLFGYDLAGVINGLTYNQQVKNLEARRESLLFSKITPADCGYRISARSTCASNTYVADDQDYTILDDHYEEEYDI